MDQWEWTRSSPVIQLIKSQTEQSIFEIDPYIAKFGPYFIHYLRRSIILLNVIVDHFDTGPDHRLDNFCLDQTTHWSAPYSKFSWRVKNKGLKMDWSGPLQWTNLQLEWTTDWTVFFLDRTTHWTTFFWTRPHTGPLFSGPDHTLDCPIFQISWGVKNKGLKMDRSGPLQWTNLQLDRTTDWTIFFWTGPHMHYLHERSRRRWMHGLI